MKLAVPPPVLPMLSKRADELPDGEGWIFEPKWDGFRTLVFRDDDTLQLQSRDEKPMLRYFPELDEPLCQVLPPRTVVDGEIVLVRGNVLDFEALQMRLHPAASRVKKLAAEMPTAIVLWDLLCIGDVDVRSEPFTERRRRLAALLEGCSPPIHLTPATSNREVAQDWFSRFEGAGLDGVMAKRSEGIYEANKRTMFKIKHQRTCDCVVAGFRWHKNGPGTHVGSLLLGLYSESDQLHHIGVTASFTEAKRKELATLLAPYRQDALATHPWKEWAHLDEDTARRPGMKSRWNAGKSMSWEPLRIELVCEVAYDHMQGKRFRHTGQFRRWRNDRSPASCRFDQLDVTPPIEIATIFGGPAAVP